MPGYKLQRQGMTRTLPNFFCIVLYIVCVVSFCVLFVCNVLMPPDGNKIAVNKYII